jgi:hypothetical protein
LLVYIICINDAWSNKYQIHKRNLQGIIRGDIIRMSGGSMQTKCQTWNYMMLTFQFVCSEIQPACGMLWVPGWQTKDPIPVFLHTGQGDSTLTWFKTFTML